MITLDDSPIVPSRIPTGLARYRDRRPMARGGNGMLQSGFDQIIGRSVAIKMLLPEHRSLPSFRRRLLREARVTAQIEHPGTVAVYDVGDDEELGIYYTMARISGESFFDVLRGIAQRKQDTVAAYPLKRRLEVISEICQTLSFAHACGVVHRDVKPANIYVGNFGEVTLLDWGSAKVWGLPALDNSDTLLPTSRSGHFGAVIRSVRHRDGDFEISPLTPAQQLIGTPTYMSPEQIGNKNIDERSDIFSVGVCLYEAMAIAEPFRGINEEETFDNICSRAPTPPCERSPGLGIPQIADDIFARATAKQPSARYQSMRELIDAIHSLIDAVA
ncbi:serine/threonine-protein kinase [Novipirellula artificiosorum]|uniref:Serine/threonine-protein kinase PknD n=1 Tax=Novipirellula artificiosorum TaxID=2528016 RepID=A0A5C6DCH0_9BACT|nr:serine/threonine-protein kinase [Novipirellula artificiosorum]TWU34368.1 Serine/threonine-protein kinase PknD [Novipirellula artificiosorum]